MNAYTGKTILGAGRSGAKICLLLRKIERQISGKFYKMRVRGRLRKFGVGKPDGRTHCKAATPACRMRR